MAQVLSVDHLSISFGGLRAVDDLSFSIDRHEIYGLIGPNGAGKTTVFNCITQFYKPDTGEIRFTDQKGKTHLLNGMPAHKIIGLGLVRTFQNTEIIRELPIIDNVLLGAHTEFRAGTLANMFAMPWARKQERELRKKAMDVLAYVGLDQIANEYAGAQPYGVLKLIELGRTLMCDRELRLCAGGRLRLYGGSRGGAIARRARHRRVSRQKLRVSSLLLCKKSSPKFD